MYLILCRTPGGTCTLMPLRAQVPGTCASAFRHQRMRVTDRIRTGAETWRGLVLTADTTVTWSLRRDSNARPSPYRGDALSAGATKAWAGEARFGRASQVPKTWGNAGLPHSPSRAACRSRTRCLGDTGSALWPDELTRHGYARRELNPHQLGSRPSPSTCCGTSAWSLWTASNRLPSPYEEDALAG